MSLDVSPDSALAPTLHTIDEAARVVREVRTSLDDVTAAAARAADDSDWQAPSARAFGEAVERWCALLRAAQQRADDLVDALARARADAAARAWAGQP